MKENAEVIGQAQAPFNTTDAILAFCLYLAGIPFFEKFKPCLNIYDADTLSRLGFSGMTLEEGTREALRRKKKGHVEYAFRQAPSLDRILKIYNHQQEEVAKDLHVDAMVQEIAQTDMDPIEKAVRLACVILKTRVQFMSLWQHMEPLIAVRNEGRSKISERRDGSKVVKRPGFRLVSLNANQKTKDKMRL